MPTETRNIALRLLTALVMAGLSASAASAAMPGLDSGLRLSPRIEATPQLLRMDSSERRAYAVSLARSDRLEISGNILTAMHRANPADRAVLFDLVSVLSWQDQHQRVMELAPQVDAATAPAYALEALARSARGSGQFGLAEKWYADAARLDPGRLEARVGLALTRADAGDDAGAREIFDRLPARYRSSVDGMLLDAYILHARGDGLLALLAYDRVLSVEPDNPAALGGKLRALREQLLPQQALAFAEAHPGLASREEIRRLKADRAALWVRWGQVSPLPGEARFADTDRALELLNTHASDFPADTNSALTTRHDRILALHDRALPGKVLAAYAELGVDDSGLPDYVLRAVAASYLAERRPADALRLYNLAAERAPGDFQLEMDRFYALVELERHAQAMALTDDLVESQAIWLQVPGSRVIKPNPRRLKAEIARALSRAYADQLAAAESLFSEMLAEAPHNTDVRQELGNVYRWRGWPRRSAFEYRQVLSVEPDLLSARIGYANAMLDLHQHSEFRPAMAALTADYPDDPGVQRIARRYELYNRNELQLSASGGESSGEQFGSRNYEADLVAYLRPVRHRWRPFVSLHTASAEFSDGDGDRRRAGLGLEYRRPDHRIALGASASVEGASRPGLALSYTWDLSDFWQFDGLLETETNAMPLRGYRVGVDASRLRAGARYRFSDQGHLALAGDYLDFSDGNRRTAWLLSGGRRILNRPDWKVDISTSLYTSRNELTAVSYFSPSSDRAVSVSLDGQWRIFRRYERSFSHRLGLTAGHYNQSGFAGGYVGSIEYQQMLQISNALEFYYGVRRNRALYDGDFEYGTYFTGGLRGRF